MNMKREKERGRRDVYIKKCRGSRKWRHTLRIWPGLLERLYKSAEDDWSPLFAASFDRNSVGKPVLRPRRKSYLKLREI